MGYTAHPHERATLISTIGPQLLDVSVDPHLICVAVDMSLWQRVAFILSIGEIAAGGTCQMNAWQGTALAMGDAKVIGTTPGTGDKTTSVITTSDVQAIVEVKSDELDMSGGFRWVDAMVVGNIADSVVCITVLGLDHRYPPGALDTSVSEVVTT